LNCKNNCSKIIVDFGPKKWQTSRLIQKRLPNFWAQIFGPNFGPAPSIKIEVQTHFDSIWLYPFSWMFSLWLYFYTLSGCHILIEKSAIFITKCNFYLWKILPCNFWKTGKKKKEITQNNKNATLPLYVFCLPKQNEFFVGLF